MLKSYKMNSNEIIRTAKTEYSYLISRIIDVYKSTFKFQLSDSYRWDPFTKTINYVSTPGNINKGISTFLHEIGHGLLDHQIFEYDIDLIKIEMEAWLLASELAAEHGAIFDEDCAQDCIESYRVWISERSKCLECEQVALEQAPQEYSCFNCSTSWKVSKQQLCQIQRRRLDKQTSS